MTSLNQAISNIVKDHKCDVGQVNREVAKLPPSLITIIEIAIQYKFYPMEIMMMCVSINLKTPKGKCIKHISRDWGFILYTQDYHHTNTVLIEFVFILPEHRRKGHFQRAIDIFKANKDIVCLTTNQRPMNLFCIKNNLKPLSLTRTKEEVFFAWSDKYDDKYILDKLF